MCVCVSVSCKKCSIYLSRECPGKADDLLDVAGEVSAASDLRVVEQGGADLVQYVLHKIRLGHLNIQDVRTHVQELV